MALDDFFANRQTDARARIFAARVQPLENGEDPVGKARLDADAVIRDRENPMIPLDLGGDANAWRSVVAKLDGVAEQVLK